MKKTILLLSFIACVLLASAQNNKPLVVPKMVKNRFQFLFPPTIDSVAHPVKWERVKPNYKGTTMVMEFPATALIDSTGKVLRVERVINEYYLPEKIKEYLKTTYKDIPVKTVSRVTNEKGKNSFSVVLEVKPTFDEDGNFARIEK